MSQAAERVVLAEAELAAAKADQAKSQREADEQAMRAAVASGRECKDQYRALESRFKQEEAAVAQLVAKFNAANAEIAAHEEAKPQPLDFPTEEECAEWERRYARLVTHRGNIREQVRTADYNKEQTRQDAIAAAKSLGHQQQVVTTLQNKLADPEGFGRGWPSGGVSRI